MIPLIPDTTYMIKSYEKNYSGPALLLKIKGLFNKRYIFRIMDNKILEFSKKELERADIAQVGGSLCKKINKKYSLKKTKKLISKTQKKKSLKKKSSLKKTKKVNRY